MESSSILPPEIVSRTSASDRSRWFLFPSSSPISRQNNCFQRIKKDGFRSNSNLDSTVEAGRIIIFIIRRFTLYPVVDFALGRTSCDLLLWCVLVSSARHLRRSSMEYCFAVRFASAPWIPWLLRRCRLCKAAKLGERR